MIVRIPSNSYSREVEEGKVDMRAGRDKKVIEKKSYWMNVCEAFPLVCKSFKLKMIDHLLLGGEHARKISPGFSSPIRDDGEVLIGTTNSSNVLLKVEQSANEALGRFFNSNSSATATLFKIKCDNSTGGDYISFNIDKAGSSVLNIEGDGDVKNTNNSYGSISDERIKKDITDANSQWDDIKALKIKNYKLKTDDESPTQLGVIAQDLETDGMNGLVVG